MSTNPKIPTKAKYRPLKRKYVFFYFLVALVLALGIYYFTMGN
jgi:hypothetical protein